jgi:hypothetical protein
MRWKICLDSCGLFLIRWTKRGIIFPLRCWVNTKTLESNPLRYTCNRLLWLQIFVDGGHWTRDLLHGEQVFQHYKLTSSTKCTSLIYPGKNSLALLCSYLYLTLWHTCNASAQFISKVVRVSDGFGSSLHLATSSVCTITVLILIIFYMYCDTVRYCTWKYDSRYLIKCWSWYDKTKYM